MIQSLLEPFLLGLYCIPHNVPVSPGTPSSKLLSRLITFGWCIGL